MITLLAGLAYASALIVMANLEERRHDDFSPTALLSLGLTQIKGIWKLLGLLILRLSPFDQPTFDYRKPVHRVAAMLLILQLSWLGWHLLAGGGRYDHEIVAPDPGPALLQLTTTALIYLALAFLGTGYGIRWQHRDIGVRLGLRMPNRLDLLAGPAMAIGLYALATLATAIWVSTVPADVFDSQTSTARLLFEILTGSLPSGLLVAVFAAVSEEILFRGALQPVFGLLISSLFFTALHLQYALTPAALILFVVALGFGLLRKHVSTTAAIIAHVLYNILPDCLARFYCGTMIG